MNGEKIAAVIPAFNESLTIGTIVEAVNSYVDDTIVVDDGSTDDTKSIARKHGAIIVVHHQNQGYASSIEDGIELAIDRDVDIVFSFDADGQHVASDIPRVVTPIQAGVADIVIGRRPSNPRLAELLFARYTKHKYGIDDPLSGFKAYRTEVYEDVGYFEQYSTIGTQLAIEGIKLGHQIEQVDVNIEDRIDDSRFGQRIEANAKIFRALWNLVLLDA